MSETIEELRQSEGYNYVQENMPTTYFTSSERGAALDGFKDGAEWEYERKKWVSTEKGGLPLSDGFYLARFNPMEHDVAYGEDVHLIEYHKDNLAYAWTEVYEWCEIPK